MIDYILAFIILWIISFMVHEFGHVFGAMLSGGKADIKIWNYKGIPSMMTVPYGTINKFLFDIFGGLLPAIMFTVLALISGYSTLRYSFVTIAFIQYAYAIYETLLINKLPRDEYMKYHYVLYLVVGVIATVLYYLLVGF